MKVFFAIASLFWVLNGQGQTTKQDLTKAFSSPERQAILQAIKVAVQPGLKLTPKLVVNTLTAKDGFAWFSGQVKDGEGKDIDFNKTTYKEAVKEGMFDGDGTAALVKKTGGKWKVLAYTIGPTDVPWGCWWKEFKAPKEIFDSAEKNCDWVK